MRTITAARLTTALEQHRKWLVGEPGGERAEFSGMALDGASLDGASLDGANLDRANLDGASLVRANLVRASLDGANLDRANLDGANLDGASLVRANLVRANLDGASLVRASLDGANLDGANLDGARLGSTTYLGSMLRLVGACQEAVNWVDAQPDHSDLSALLARTSADYRSWLRRALGGETTPERLLTVFEFVVRGVR